MNRLAWVASAALILVADSAEAQPTNTLLPGLFFNLEFGVRDRTPDLHFGARFDYGETFRKQGTLRAFDGEPAPAQGAQTDRATALARWNTPGLLQLDISAHRDLTLSAGGLPLAGYRHVLHADGTESSQSGWFARNWGWTLAGTAAVVGVAVAAGGGHGGGGVNTQNANQCQVTVVGTPPTNTSGCAKSSTGSGK